MPYSFTRPENEKTLHLEYTNLASGRYKYVPSGMGIFAYYAARGGNVSTNEFWDSDLQGGKSEIENIMHAILSAKKNGYLNLEIVIDVNIFQAIANDIAKLAIESQTQISIAFPSEIGEKHTMLVKIAIENGA